MKDDYILDTEQRISGLKYVLTLSDEEVIDLALGRSSGYKETAADWLLFRCDDSRMMGSV